MWCARMRILPTFGGALSRSLNLTALTLLHGQHSCIAQSLRHSVCGFPSEAHHPLAPLWRLACRRIRVRGSRAAMECSSSKANCVIKRVRDTCDQMLLFLCILIHNDCRFQNWLKLVADNLHSGLDTFGIEAIETEKGRLRTLHAHAICCLALIQSSLQ